MGLGFDCCGYCDLFVDGCGVLRLGWYGLVVYAVPLIGCLVWALIVYVIAFVCYLCGCYMLDCVCCCDLVGGYVVGLLCFVIVASSFCAVYLCWFGIW